MKLKASIATEFEKAGHTEIAHRLDQCHTTELLVVCTSCSHRFWTIAKCKLRTCPICAYKVAKDRGDMLIALTKKLQFPKLVTLTMPTWTGEPRDGIALLRQHFNYLRKSELFSSVKAGAYTIELIRKPEGWHIHTHILMDCKFIPYQKLFSAWQRLTGTNAPHVDIRSAENDKARRYVAKYAAKASDFGSNVPAVVEWHFAVKGMRLFSCFGEWYNITLEEALDPENPEPFRATCPCCGKEKSLIYARDGPFIYGNDDWSKLVKFLAPDGILWRASAEWELLYAENKDIS